MAIARIGSVQTTDPWGAYDVNPMERDPSVYPRQIDESTRQTQEINYTPVSSPSVGGGGGGNESQALMQAYNQIMANLYPAPAPHGNTPYWENPNTYYPQQAPIDPIAQAKAATMAAQKFIAFRGYQSDLKEGMAAADAFAKWGPMLVQDTSFGPSMKAMQRPRTGQWVAPNPTTQQPGFFREPTQYGERANYPAAGLAPSTWVEANPQTGEPAHWSNAGRVEQIRTATRGNEITPTAALNVISDPQKWAFAQDALGTDATNLVNIAKAGLPKPTGPQATAVEKSAPQAVSGPPVVTSKAEFDKLPHGAIYLNKGKPYRKP